MSSKEMLRGPEIKALLGVRRIDESGKRTEHGGVTIDGQPPRRFMEFVKLQK